MATNLRDKAYRAIKDKILKGRIDHSGFLNEAELMKELDVSRTPIREALSRLEQEGLVAVLPKKGVLVKPLTVSEISQGFEVRMIMEPYIVETYSKFINKDDLMEIKALSKELITMPPNPSRFAQLDDHLHRVIAAACPNIFIRNMLNKVFDQNIRIRIYSEKNLWKRHIEAAKEHIRLIDFILDNRIDNAKDAMIDHLKKSKESQMTALRDRQINAW
jgi:DNA-binding GntR family transcriptional regulator